MNITEVTGLVIAIFAGIGGIIGSIASAYWSSEKIKILTDKADEQDKRLDEQQKEITDQKSQIKSHLLRIAELECKNRDQEAENKSLSEKLIIMDGIIKEQRESIIEGLARADGRVHNDRFTDRRGGLVGGA